MAQKAVCLVILIADSVKQNLAVEMARAMVPKIATRVRKIVALVARMEYFVEMVHVMVQKTARLVLKIAALVIQHIAEMEHAMGMKQNGLAHKIAGHLIIVAMVIVCPIWARIQ